MMAISYIANIVFLPMAVVVLVPVFVLAFECTVAAIAGSSVRGPQIGTRRPKISVIIPAHNEQAVIGETLDLIKAQLVKTDRLIVIADNCDDNTAQIARKHGATVIERLNTEHRGKGYALESGIRSLEKSNPEIVVFIDADCAVQDETIDRLSRFAFERNAPVQSENLMVAPESGDINHRVSQFAWLVKNHVRPLGLMRLGLPCQLMGTGMALPWSAIKHIHLGSGNIVEDLQLGIDLALAGRVPMFCPETRVVSKFPATREASTSQRKRWEHGHLQTIIHQAPRLLAKGVARLDYKLIGMALDLCVPPTALLALLLVFGSFAGAVIAVIGGPTAPAELFLSGAFVFFCTIFLTWFRFGRDIFSLQDFLSIPGYVFRKITIYRTFLTKRQKEWIRTDRD